MDKVAWTVKEPKVVFLYKTSLPGVVCVCGGGAQACTYLLGEQDATTTQQPVSPYSWLSLLEYCDSWILLPMSYQLPRCRLLMESASHICLRVGSKCLLELPCTQTHTNQSFRKRGQHCLGPAL